MKMLCLFAAAFILLAGCSSNQIKVENQSWDQIQVVFRGKAYPVAKGAVQTITDIPNGTFGYSTMYTVPDGYVSSDAASAAAGDLDFIQGKTDVYLLYGSSETQDSSGNKTYHLSCVLSSSNNLATAPTSP